MRNDELQASVTAELAFDPKVDSREIAVSADGGAVTLRGTICSLRQMREAQTAARRIDGVGGISNRLQVRILGADRRSDADLRANVLQALMLDGLIPASIDARVRDGLVTLAGTAGWQYQRDEAESVCASVPGVIAIGNEISLTPAAFDVDVQRAISAAFARSARLAADELSVDAPIAGTAVVSGVVGSWTEHDEAVAAAWSAPGVTVVDNRIVVAG